MFRTITKLPRIKKITSAGQNSLNIQEKRSKSFKFQKIIDNFFSSNIFD